MKSIRDSKQLYWGLIITFFVLYFCVGFVSTLHSITFFELANAMWMAVLLGVTYEVGQASVLFSILMTKNSQKLLPWLLMFLLTGLQVTANVYASFKFMDSSGSTDWTFWQRSILFWMETDSPEMFKVVISWITGALLPIVALGMTALVAENLKLKDEEEANKEDEIPPPGKDDTPPVSDTQEMKLDYTSEMIEDLKNIKPMEYEDVDPKIPSREEQLEALRNKIKDPRNHLKFPKDVELKDGEIKKPIQIDLSPTDNVVDPDHWKKIDGLTTYIEKDSSIKDETSKKDKSFSVPEIKIDASTLFEKKPINNKRGWHLKKEFIDDNGDVYHFGQFQSPKKA